MSSIKTMYLVTVPFSQTEKSFRLIPATNNCPYLDVVYWKDKKVLEVVLPFKKNEYNVFVKLNDNGDPEERKQPVKDAQGNVKRFKEERKMTEVMMNFYITEKEEIDKFVSAVALNAEEYDYKKYLNATDIILSEQPKIVTETPVIITP